MTFQVHVPLTNRRVITCEHAPMETMLELTDETYEWILEHAPDCQIITCSLADWVFEFVSLDQALMFKLAWGGA